jgi:Ca-activated chloride channel family protein
LALSPVLKSKVDIKVTGIIARTKLTQTFKNPGKDWVNGLYVFPLPENAAIDHLIMRIGERKIEGQIKPKEEAKKIYQQAKAAGKKASLVAQQRPNIFSNSIANIGPGETVEVTIEYQQTLSYDQQQYSLRFPMTITPRYTPSQSIEESKLKPIFASEQDHNLSSNIDLQLNLHPGFDLQDIQSEFHAITTKQMSDGSVNIQLSPQDRANQDFVLNWRAELGATPQSAHYTQKVNGDEYGLVMLLPPNSIEGTQLKQKREVIFVLDTSGSMEGAPLKQAKAALLFAVKQLKTTDSFNVIEFNSYAQNLWTSPKVADLNNKQDAQYFVQSLSANGGTEMQSALNLAFAQPVSNTDDHSSTQPLRQIIFITDGSVSNETALMQLISAQLKDSRLFTVGIGSAPNSYFMSEAAKMGRGTFTYIGCVEEVREKMLTLLTKLQYPALIDIELQLNTDTSRIAQQIEFYPNIIGDLYLGEPLVLSYKLTKSASTSNENNAYLHKIKLSAQYQGKPWKDALTLSAQTRHSGLNVLWAREKIAQLSRDKRRANMSPNASAEEADKYKKQITQTALTHHLVSQYTSLVAVDVTPTRPIGNQVHDKKVANRLPKGSVNQRAQLLGRLPQTATTAQLKLIFGLILIGLALCMHLLTKRNIFTQNSSQ